MPALGPTTQQAPVLSFVTERLRTVGISPTYEEIQEHCSIASKSTVHRLLAGLVERGQLAKEPDRPRGLTLPAICPCCGKPR